MLKDMFLIIFDILSSCYFILIVLFRLWESVRYWMPMWQTHKTIFRLLLLIYELSVYEINSR